MKICIAGRNTLAVECLKFLINDRKTIQDNLVVCCSTKDIGIDGFEPSLRKFATERGLSVLELKETYEIENLYFFSLQYDKILRPNLFMTKNLFNIHFSFLPEFKGMYPSIMPILNGKDYSGVTLHFIDEGIDTGDIISQTKFTIDITDTARSLYFKYMKHGFELFKANFDLLLKGEFVSRPQSALNSTYFSQGSLNFSDIKIDLNKTSFEIHNQFRAFIFEEYQLPEFKNQKIVKSILTDEKIARNQILETDDHFEVSGIDGFKLILKKYGK